MAFTSTKRDDTTDFTDYKSPAAESRSFFGKTMKIEGEITSDEDVTIEGKLKGQLEVNKTLTIGRNGYVDGKISASIVRISGEAEGEIAASEKLEISSEGKYTGNIHADKIVIAEGAKLKGTINMEAGEIVPSKTTAPAVKTIEKKDKKPAPSGEQVQEKKE
jgi:cytoskeletal protein CcmA (bactofilin family)